MSDLSPEHEARLDRLQADFTAVKAAMRQFWKCTDDPTGHGADQLLSAAQAFSAAYMTFIGDGVQSSLQFIANLQQVIGDADRWDD